MKTIKHSKLGVFLFGISLLLSSCEKDVKVDSILENKQHRKYDLSIQEKVTITDEQLLKELRIPFNTTSLYKSTNKQLSKNKTVEVNTNEVAIAKTPAYEVYTFPLKNYDSSYDFQNLAVVKREAKELEYLLLSYLKDSAPKNPNFPYKVYQQSLGNDLDVVFSEKQAKTQSRGVDENKCYVLTYLHCGCPGGTSDPSHTAQLCACGTGSKPVLRETICSGNGCGDCPVPEDDTPPATNPDDLDPTSPSGDGGGGGGGGAAGPGGPIYIYEGDEECFSDGTCTPPLYVPTVLDINLSDVLTGEQLLFLSQYPDLKSEIKDFLRANNNSSEAQSFVGKVIEAYINDTWPTNSPILSELTVNEIAEFNWYETSSSIKVDAKKLMKCFRDKQTSLSSNTTYSLTVYIEQPVPNTSQTYSGTDPGHTFISMSVNDPNNSNNNLTQTFGYYPANSVNPLIGNNTTSGEFRDNSGHNYHVSATISLNNSNFYKLVTFVESWSNSIPQYDLQTNNCTDFGIKAGNLVGMSLPDTMGSWSIKVPVYGNVKLGEGSNPGNLGQDLRNLSNSNLSIKTTSGSPAKNGKGECN